MNVRAGAGGEAEGQGQGQWPRLSGHEEHTCTTSSCDATRSRVGVLGVSVAGRCVGGAAGVPGSPASGLPGVSIFLNRSMRA